MVDQRRFNNQQSDFLSAQGAARFLGVKLQTLYSYASRGLVRSEPGSDRRGPARRYSRADLERLKTRGEARRGHGPVAGGALLWGEPVLRTAVSTIRAEGPVYRGESAVSLATKGARFEAVAELLWSGSLALDASWSGDEVSSDVRRIAPLLSPASPTEPPLGTLLAAIPLLALRDPERFAAPLAAEWARARRLIRALSALSGAMRGRDVALRAVAAPTVADSVAIALGAPPKTRDAIDRTLVLAADHELNASTFAARVVASTGADLYASVIGALSALTGPRHGGASDRLEALLDEVGEPARARAVILSRSSRGEAIPGFGHRLYPDGDPRVPPLLEVASRVAGSSDRLSTLRAVAAAMEKLRHGSPNLDFGLVAVRRGLGLPRGSASVLFALGRTAGWVAHALEQRETNQLLRPRAEYVGKEPA